ncbi:MAG: hypothetical protein P8P54_12855, partial [Pseudomonadales bacterium]|nr:hypothetical protein [Pseudomonadales bacterium]
MIIATKPSLRPISGSIAHQFLRSLKLKNANYVRCKRRLHPETAPPFADEALVSVDTPSAIAR